MGVASIRRLATLQTILSVRRLSLMRPGPFIWRTQVVPSLSVRHHAHTAAEAPRQNKDSAGHARTTDNRKQGEVFYRSLFDANEDEPRTDVSGHSGTQQQTYLPFHHSAAQRCQPSIEVNEEHREAGGIQLHAGNTEVWIDQLLVAQRLHGLDGIRAVWTNLQTKGIDLPTSGEHADNLWDVLVTPEALGEENKLLASVWEYAQQLKDRTGTHHDKLYKLIVGRSFRIDPGDAKRWHLKLTEKGFAPPDGLKQVAVDAMLGPKSALTAFSEIYEASEERNLYDSCIVDALSRGEAAQALHLHRLFIKNGDKPSPELSSIPEVQRLFQSDNSSSLLKNIAPGDAALELHRNIPNPAVSYPKLTRSSMNTIVGEVHGIRPKEISDTFCAKMFATRALSLNLVLRGLSFLAVEKLGSIALREMALRAGDPAKFSDGLVDLERYNIGIGDSIFTKLILRLAKEGHPDLWKALVESDIHPEAYEEIMTLQSLLDSFLEQKKPFQVHVVLLALHLSGNDGSTRAWNAILQHYAIKRNYPLMMSCLQAMQSQRVQLVRRTLTMLHLHALPPRRPSKAQKKFVDPMGFKAVEFVTQAYMYAASSGSFVHWQLWREQLKRYGLDHHWEKLERLVLWLLSHYRLSVSPYEPHSSLTLSERKAKFRRASLLGLLFQTHMQQALFVWGFRSASVRDQLRSPERKTTPSEPARNGNDMSRREESCERWAQGLALVMKLRQSGVYLNMQRMRRAFVTRMWILFGPAYSERALNSETRRVNRLSLAHYIKHANEVCNGLIYWVPPALLDEGKANSSQLLVAFFGEVKQVNWREDWEFADVQAWSDWLEKTDRPFLYDGRNVPERRRMWQNSPFRIVRQRPPLREGAEIFTT